MSLQETSKDLKAIINVLVGSLTLGAILALRPFIVIRIGRIRSYRIGSFIGDLDRHLAYTRVSLKPRVE